MQNSLPTLLKYLWFGLFHAETQSDQGPQYLSTCGSLERNTGLCQYFVFLLRVDEFACRTDWADRGQEMLFWIDTKRLSSRGKGYSEKKNPISSLERETLYI